MHWGDEGYAQEELVAELGSAFQCADLELAAETREENASYIANWLEVLKNDTRFIFKAAAHASERRTACEPSAALPTTRTLAPPELPAPLPCGHSLARVLVGLSHGKMRRGE